MSAYEEMFNNTSTPHAPWYIIPADHKWFTRLAVVSAIWETLDGLNLRYPEASQQEKEALLAAKAEMEQENEDSGAGQKARKGRKKS
jgi:hypothetical protein